MVVSRGIRTFNDAMIKFGEDATIGVSVVLGVSRFCRGILMVVIVGMLVAVFVLVLVLMVMFAMLCMSIVVMSRGADNRIFDEVVVGVVVEIGPE